MTKETVTFKNEVYEGETVVATFEETFDRIDAPDYYQWSGFKAISELFKQIGKMDGRLIRGYVNGFEINGTEYVTHLNDIVRVRNFDNNPEKKPLICLHIGNQTVQYYHYDQLVSLDAWKQARREILIQFVRDHMKADDDHKDALIQQISEDNKSAIFVTNAKMSNFYRENPNL